MSNYEHSVTVTDPSGHVLFRVGGDSQHDEGLSDGQIRERVKANILRDLKWDIKIFRTR